MTVLSACNIQNSSTGATKNNGKLNVVATIFPEYDFLRQIAGDHINLSMLLKPGAESHTYEPTPQDILTVQSSNLFVYVGGDSDAWVDSILESMDQSKMNIVTLMDCVSLVPEETVEGMQPEENSLKQDDVEENDVTINDVEMDEHVWTSPRNAELIVQKLCDELCELDPANAQDYQQNTTNYIAKLARLDDEFQDVVDHADRKEIVVGDRFPFRYFVNQYGISYYAAFPGCSTDTEASAATLAFLIDKVKADKIPVVFHIELSNEQMCDSICSATGAKKELLNAVHNVSKTDFDAGVTYMDLMEHNVQVLKEALN
jgi:zinc transport system substrate-binding protein